MQRESVEIFRLGRIILIILAASCLFTMYTGSCKSDTWKNAFGLYNDDIELFRRFPRCKQKTTGDLHKEFILEKVRARDEAWAESYLEEIYQKNRKLLQEAKII